MMPPARKNPKPIFRAGPSSSRSRVLAQWRGVDVTPEEIARATPARSSADLIPLVLKEWRLDAKQAEAEVVKVWNSLIDPVVTAHAQPSRLVKGTLFVDVDSSVWLAEIVRYRRHEILARLQSSFGPQVIQKISFRAG